MFKGLYINLDRKPERRRRIEAEISRQKLSKFYERISAVDGHNGETGGMAGAIGCFHSHVKALQIGSRGGQTLHILEDDAILSARLMPFLGSAECAAALARYDLVFLDMWINPALVPQYQQAMTRAGKGISFMNARNMMISATDSYLVAARSLKKVHALLEQETVRGLSCAVDVFYRRVVDAGFLTAAIAVPFLTCIDIETGSESAIQIIGQQAQREAVMTRMAFFVEPDRQQR